MKKVGVYMRVGNKEQLELTEEQKIEAMQRIADNMQGTVTPRKRAIPTPEELKAEGYDVVTLPKKKAWLFLRSSVGIPNVELQSTLNSLKNAAHERGYEIIGETVVVGTSDKSKQTIESLLNGKMKESGAELLFMRGTRDISFKFGEVSEVYDMIMSAGYTMDTVDGSIEMMEGKTENGMNVRDIIKSITDTATEEQPDPSEDEAPTQTIGGG